MIAIVAGVSGSGKTTVGILLAGRLGWRFADADDFHPAANVAKMRAGIPLTDADRGPWLRAITAWMDERIARGEDAVVGCSALKRAYRDRLRNVLVYRILQRFSSPELRYPRRLDLDRRAGARIASLAGRPLADVKRAESDQRDDVALFERSADRIDRRVQCASGRRFRNIGVLGNRVDQF